MDFLLGQRFYNCCPLFSLSPNTEIVVVEDIVPFMRFGENKVTRGYPSE